MQIDILTLFPEMFVGPFSESIVKRAQDKKLVNIDIHNLRNWAHDNHKTVDDKPYGGGAGMLMRVDIVDRAINDVRRQTSVVDKLKNKTRVILLDARGKTYDQKKAIQLSKVEHLILIAGHYEGIDYRVQKYLVDEVVSIGNYVLSGGEIPAMAMVDSIVRLIPGVIDPESLKEESFNQTSDVGGRVSVKTEYPQYTRPENYKGWKVPKVLLSGNHKEIEAWKKANNN